MKKQKVKEYKYEIGQVVKYHPIIGELPRVGGLDTVQMFINWKEW